MKKNRWTVAETELLKSGVAPANRSFDSIDNMRKKLGMIKYRSHRWTDADKSTLIELVKQGNSTKEISKILPYSIRGVQKQIAYLNLPRKRNYRFTRIELQEFKKFLLKNWEQKTPEELMNLWNSLNKKQILIGKVHKHLRAMNIKIPQAEVLRISLFRKKEKKLLISKSIDTIRSIRSKMMRDRISLNRDLWTGLPLPIEELNQA